MAGPFSTPVADSVPMDNDALRTSALTESVQDFINEICPADRSQKPSYLTNGELEYMEYFNGPTQVIGDRRYRVDITYDAGLNPVQEEWKMYDPLDGTTVLRTVTYTHSFTAADLTKTEMVTV